MSLTAYPTLRLKLTMPTALKLQFLPAVPGFNASQVANKVNRTGDTMSGQLFLVADPSFALEAATKQYVDAHSGSGTLNPSKLAGRGSASGVGVPQEITLGTNLTMSGTTLNATGGGGTGNVTYTASSTAPVSPAAGDLWYDLSTGVLSIRVNDGTSSQWVMVAPPGGGSVAAAPLDALAYNGMQINGSMEVSQENGSALVSTTSAKYLADVWIVQSNGAQTTFASNAGAPPAGYINTITLSCNPANASPAASNFCLIQQRIEGYKIARLAWGTASAQPITIAFWIKSTRTGTFSGSVANGTSARSYVFSFTINAANTWEFKTVTVTGDTTGTWATDSNTGMIVTITAMAGSTFTTSAGVWSAGNFVGVTGTVNGIAATADAFYLTGVIVLPGIEAPSAARSPFIMRPYDQELVTCMRYFEAWPLANGAYAPIATGQATSTTSAQVFTFFKAIKRSVPTFNISAAGDFVISLNNGTPAVLTGLSLGGVDLGSAYLLPVVSGGLVVGNATSLYRNNVNAAKLTFDARL